MVPVFARHAVQIPHHSAPAQGEFSDQPFGPAHPQARGIHESEIAYSIIESLLEHTRVLSDLVALMAQTLDEDTTKALTRTPHWQAYIDSRRVLERTNTDVERFAKVMKKLSDD